MKLQSEALFLIELKVGLRHKYGVIRNFGMKELFPFNLSNKLVKMNLLLMILILVVQFVISLAKCIGNFFK